jgi:hypothetical protein
VSHLRPPLDDGPPCACMASERSSLLEAPSGAITHPRNSSASSASVLAR